MMPWLWGGAATEKSSHGEFYTYLHSPVDVRIEGSGTALAIPNANADSYLHIIPKQQSQDKEAISANVLELNITE